MMRFGTSTNPTSATLLDTAADTGQDTGQVTTPMPVDLTGDDFWDNLEKELDDEYHLFISNNFTEEEKPADEESRAEALAAQIEDMRLIEDISNGYLADADTGPMDTPDLIDFGTLGVDVVGCISTVEDALSRRTSVEAASPLGRMPSKSKDMNNLDWADLDVMEEKRIITMITSPKDISGLDADDWADTDADARDKCWMGTTITAKGQNPKGKCSDTYLDGESCIRRLSPTKKVTAQVFKNNATDLIASTKGMLRSTTKDELPSPGTTEQKTPKYLDGEECTRTLSSSEKFTAQVFKNSATDLIASTKAALCASAIRQEQPSPRPSLRGPANRRLPQRRLSASV